MRIPSSIVAISTALGLVLLVSGTLLGCGAFFSWNGRHVVDAVDVSPGAPLSHALTPERDRRYTVAIDVLFDRREEDPHAKLPIVFSIVDVAGEKIVETKGWIDPDEPPTVLLGARPSPRAGPDQELAAERVVGTLAPRASEPVDLRVELGEDRTGGGRVRGARLMVFDDALPPAIKRAFAAAVAGGILFTLGAIVSIARIVRRAARRGGIRGR